MLQKATKRVRMGDNLKAAGVEFATLSWSVLLHDMHSATSRVENLAQVLYPLLKFVHGQSCCKKLKAKLQ